MSGFLKAIGVLMMVLGGLVLLVAKSAFHEILSATGIGLGAVVLALGVVADRLSAILTHMTRRFPIEAEVPKPGEREVDAMVKPDHVVSWQSRGTR